MSKTYRDSRRVKRNQAIKQWLNGPLHLPYPGDDFHRWTSSYPHWWDTLHHHAKARRFNRDKLHQVLKDPESDDGNWRDHRKPHIYYW